MKKSIIALAVTLSLVACTKAPETNAQPPEYMSYASKPPASEIDAVGEALAAVEAAAEDPSTPAYDVTTGEEGDATAIATGADTGIESDGSGNQLFTNHFNVRPQMNFQGSDEINIQKITDGRLVVKDVVVNRGRCALLNKPDPRAMEYSSKMTVYLWGCEATDILDVTIVTDQGYVTYGF